MRTDTGRMAPLLGHLAHPVTAALVVVLAGAAGVLAAASGQHPVLLAWVVVALAGGYAISGSV